MYEKKHDNYKQEIIKELSEAYKIVKSYFTKKFEGNLKLISDKIKDL
jgi:uncharacterized protein Yka (UPF0111/DUF47 family)